MDRCKDRTVRSGQGLGGDGAELGFQVGGGHGGGAAGGDLDARGAPATRPRPATETLSRVVLAAYIMVSAARMMAWTVSAILGEGGQAEAAGEREVEPLRC